VDGVGQFRAFAEVDGKHAKYPTPDFLGIFLRDLDLPLIHMEVRLVKPYGARFSLPRGQIHFGENGLLGRDRFEQAQVIVVERFPKERADGLNAQVSPPETSGTISNRSQTSSRWDGTPGWEKSFATTGYERCLYD
jgi:hypothetical protein